MSTLMGQPVRPRRAVEPAGQPSPRGAVLLAGLAALGLLTALLSLHGADVTDLGEYGLLPALPITWYLGLALLVLASAAVSVRTSVPGWLGGGCLLALVLVLYGSVPLLAEAPRYAWTYKHVGVTRYIEVFGQIDPTVDIYHRWPGFFTLAALYGSLAGRPDPVSYAGWTGVFFVVLQALLVVVIARTCLRERPAAWSAGLVFALINWVGQDYFAPQPFAFAVALGVVWVCLRQFSSVPGPRLCTVLAGVLSWLTRTPPEPLAARRAGGWSNRAAGSVLAVLFLALVPSHQLTPYLVVVLLAALAVLGLLRPWWLPVLLGAAAALYLLPNLDYVRSTFGLFSGFDFFSNARSATDSTYAVPGKLLAARAGRLLSALAVMAAAVVTVLAWRNGQRRLLAPVVCLLAPVLLLFGQSYGGEGALRVILFSSPWAAVLIASGVATPLRRRGKVAFLALLGVLTALFLPAYLGQEEINMMPASEVVASRYLYDNAVPGSVVVLAGPNFPIRLTERYPLLRGPLSDKDPNLLSEESRQRRAFGPLDVPAVVDVIHDYSDHGYVVFSRTEEQYATVYGLSSAADLRGLEDQLVWSGRFRPFYRNDSTRIYELVP